ncbi:MAG: hypothetical protein ACREHV_01035 [Rhizomicrobium sp.]
MRRECDVFPARSCRPPTPSRADDRLGPIGQFDPFGSCAPYACLALLLVGAIAAVGFAAAPYLFALVYLPR